MRIWTLRTRNRLNSLIINELKIQVLFRKIFNYFAQHNIFSIPEFHSFPPCFLHITTLLFTPSHLINLSSFRQIKLENISSSQSFPPKQVQNTPHLHFIPDILPDSSNQTQRAQSRARVGLDCSRRSPDCIRSWIATSDLSDLYLVPRQQSRLPPPRAMR